MPTLAVGTVHVRLDFGFGETMRSCRRVMHVSLSNSCVNAQYLHVGFLQLTLLLL